MMSSAQDQRRYVSQALTKKLNPQMRSRISNPQDMPLVQLAFHKMHICRMPQDQWPEPILRSYASANHVLSESMYGTNPFEIGGQLAKWNRSHDLKRIGVPTLTIGAKYDIMDPKHMEWMSTQFPNGSYSYCPNGGSLCMYDD